MCFYVHFLLGCVSWSVWGCINDVERPKKVHFPDGFAVFAFCDAISIITKNDSKKRFVLFTNKLNFMFFVSLFFPIRTSLRGCLFTRFFTCEFNIASSSMSMIADFLDNHLLLIDFSVSEDELCFLSKCPFWWNIWSRAVRFSRFFTRKLDFLWRAA